MQIADVDGDDEVRFRERLVGRERHVQGMAVREVDATVHVDDGGADLLGQRDELVERIGMTPGELGDDHRPLRAGDHVGGARQRRGLGLHRRGPASVHDALYRERMADLVLLQTGVVAEVHRARGLGRRDAERARERGGEVVDRRGLVIPLREVPHRLALHLRGVDPVDRRSAPPPIHRPGAAHHDHRHAVELCVVDAHRRMQEADDIVDDRAHRLTRGLRVAVRERDGDLLVRTEDDLGLALAVVHERVVKPAVRRAGVERDVFDAEALEQIDDDVAAETGRALLRPPRPRSGCDLGYLPTPRFSASDTYLSSNTFVTSMSFTFGFCATSASRDALNDATVGCG